MGIFKFIWHIIYKKVVLTFEMYLLLSKVKSQWSLHVSFVALEESQGVGNLTKIHQ